MVWLVFAATAALGVNVGVDFSSTATSPLAHMWRATGWAPPLPVAHYKDYAVQVCFIAPTFDAAQPRSACGAPCCRHRRW